MDLTSSQRPRSVVMLRSLQKLRDYSSFPFFFKFQVFRHVTLCSWASGFQCFEEVKRLLLQGQEVKWTQPQGNNDEGVKIRG
jgi:hypothetical protein